MKRVIRKPTAREKQFIDAVRAHDGLEIYRDDWPRLEEMLRDGLIEVSPPRGPGKAWKRVALVGQGDW